jgi:hypothetical protein
MSLSKLAYGNVTQNGGNPIAVFYLGNNTKTGEYLAVYGILAYRPAFPQLMAAWVINHLENVVPGNISMMVPGTGQIAGTVSTNNVSGPFGAITNPIQFVADGKQWLTLGDVPMFVVPPGQSLLVSGAPQFGTIPVNEWATVSFLWGIHGSPTPPALPKGA